MKTISIATPEQLFVNLEQLSKECDKQKIFEFVETQDIDNLAKMTDSMLKLKSVQSKLKMDHRLAEDFIYYVSTLLLFLQNSVNAEPKAWFGKNFYETMNSLLKKFEISSTYGTVSI